MRRALAIVFARPFMGDGSGALNETGIRGLSRRYFVSGKARNGTFALPITSKSYWFVRGLRVRHRCAGYSFHADKRRWSKAEKCGVTNFPIAGGES